MKIEFIKSSEEKQITKELEKTYGITDTKNTLIRTGRERIRAYSGILTKQEIRELSAITNIEIIGMYIINTKDKDYRLSFDAVSLLKDKINKSIIKINKDQKESWIRGNILEIKTQKGVVVIQYEDDLIGIGKSNGQKIFNYIPKERKIKTPLKKPENEH